MKLEERGSRGVDLVYGIGTYDEPLPWRFERCRPLEQKEIANFKSY